MKTSFSKNLWVAAFVYIIINLIQSYFTPLIDDEAYYWAWSQKLDWGYFDHPPMVALWIKMGFALFQNELGVRLITVFAGGLGYILLGKTLNIESEKEFWLYTALYFSTVLFAAFGFITTPDSPLLFFGILYIYVLKRFLENPNFRHALFWGFAMALLIYSKYHGILLIGFSILPLTLKLIKNKYFYIAVFFGVLCYIPHLWWQCDNDFVSVQYHIVRRNVFNHFKISNTTDYLLSLVWASSPLLFYHNIKAVFKTKYNTDFLKAMLWSFAGIIGFFLLVTLKRYIQGQWSLLAFIPLIIIAFYYYRTNSKAISLMKKWAFVMLGLMVLFRIYFAYQDVPYKTQYHGWKDFMQRAGEVTEGVAVFEKYQYTSLFSFYNYPEKKAENYITIENRNSQYQLWNSESQLEGKDVTYFSKYVPSNDSLVVNSRDENVFKYQNIKDFHTAKNLVLEIDNFELSGKNFTAKMHVVNEGSFKVDCSLENGFSLKQVYVKYAYSEDIKFVKPIYYEPFVLEPNQEKIISIEGTTNNMKSDEYLTYFGFVNQNLPPKNQSNYIELKID